MQVTHWLLILILFHIYFQWIANIVPFPSFLQYYCCGRIIIHSFVTLGFLQDVFVTVAVCIFYPLSLSVLHVLLKGHWFFKIIFKKPDFSFWSTFWKRFGGVGERETAIPGNTTQLQGLGGGATECIFPMFLHTTGNPWVTSVPLANVWSYTITAP